MGIFLKRRRNKKPQGIVKDITLKHIAFKFNVII